MSAVRRAASLTVLALAILLGTTGCVTKFRTAAPLSENQQRVVAKDLAVAGVLTRRPGESGARLPKASARFARLTGADDQSSSMSEQDLEVLLASPSTIRSSTSALQDVANRIGHRYVLVGEASTAPTDERKSWIIQIVVPIPFLWISFGIPVEYASTLDAPHATASARVIDLQRGEILAASFEVGSDIDADEVPEFANSAASRAVKRMSLAKP
jgi:hypothetical protein